MGVGWVVFLGGGSLVAHGVAGAVVCSGVADPDLKPVEP